MSVTVPDPSLDFLPLFAWATEEKLLADWQAWANEGLDPVADADAWVDTREGGHWQTCSMTMIRECARIYDLMGTEVPMSGFVLWAWETYLDDLAAVYDIARLPATPALGIIEFAGPVGTEIDAGTNLSSVPSTPDDPAPLFEVTEAGTIPVGGVLDLPIQATEAGSAGNVAALAITAQSTPLPPGVTFSNPDPTRGGSDVESDDALRERILEAIAGKGPGAVADYVRWAGAWPGVGRVTVVPVWNGAGTVLVMISDPLGLPLPDAIVAALQQDLDPVPGTGAGTAPVGAIVTVDTTTLLNLAVEGHIDFLTGFSWDGAGGTVAIGSQLEAAITRYFLSVAPGGTVRIAHVAGLVATWPGVENASGVEIDPGSGFAAADVPVPLGPPPKIAVLSGFTVT